MAALAPSVSPWTISRIPYSFVPPGVSTEKAGWQIRRVLSRDLDHVGPGRAPR